MSSIHGTKAVGHWGQRRTLWWVESENLGVSFHFCCCCCCYWLTFIRYFPCARNVTYFINFEWEIFFFLSIFLSWTQGTNKLKHIEYSTSSKMYDHKPDCFILYPCLSKIMDWLAVYRNPCNHEMVYDKIFPDFMYNSIWLFRDKLSFPFVVTKGHLCSPKQHCKLLSNFLSIYFLE